MGPTPFTKQTSPSFNGSSVFLNFSTSRFCFFISIHIENRLYGIFKADLISDEYDWAESTEIYELDIENKKINYVADCDFDMTETVYSRGSRIYFLNSRNIQNFICTYYDTETGKWGEEFSITQEEILEM